MMEVFLRFIYNGFPVEKVMEMFKYSMNMNRKSTRIPVGALLVVLWAGIAPGKVYTLDPLIEDALKNSVPLQSVKREIDQVESEIQELFAGLFPQISGAVDVGHTFAYYLPFVVKSFPDGAAVSDAGAYPTDGGILARKSAAYQQNGMLSSDLFTIPSNTATSALTLSQPLFLQGKTVIRFKIARARQRMTICKYEETRNLVKGETIKLFYRVLLEQKRLAGSSEHRDLAEEEHRIATVNFSFGRARELDTLNSLLQLEQARIDHDKAESDRRSACEAIITHCGIAENPSAFWVDGEFPEPVFLITTEEAVEQLHRGNHRIIQMKGDEIVQRERVRLAKADYLPMVLAGATVGKVARFSELERLDDIDWGDDQKVFVSLSWTLFSGLSRQHVVRQQIARRDIAFLSQKRTIDSLELAVRTSWEQTKMELEQLSAWETVVTIAHKSHAVAVTAAGVGSVTPLELQNARLELNKKILGYTEALYSFHCSVTDFKMLIGML